MEVKAAHALLKSYKNEADDSVAAIAVHLQQAMPTPKLTSTPNVKCERTTSASTILRLDVLLCTFGMKRGSCEIVCNIEQ